MRWPIQVSNIMIGCTATLHLQVNALYAIICDVHAHRRSLGRNANTAMMQPSMSWATIEMYMWPHGPKLCTSQSTPGQMRMHAMHILWEKLGAWVMDETPIPSKQLTLNVICWTTSMSILQIEDQTSHAKGTVKSNMPCSQGVIKLCCRARIQAVTTQFFPLSHAVHENAWAWNCWGLHWDLLLLLQSKACLLRLNSQLASGSSRVKHFEVNSLEVSGLMLVRLAAKWALWHEVGRLCIKTVHHCWLLANHWAPIRQPYCIWSRQAIYSLASHLLY